MYQAIRLRRRRHHQVREFPVRTFQQIQRKPALRVVVVERENQRLGRLAYHPRPERLGQLIVGSRRFRLLLGLRFQHEIIGQSESNAFRHAPDLVLAIGVERSEAGGLASRCFFEQKHFFGRTMLNGQLPAFKRVRQYDDQARHHPVVLLAVAVWQEEPALLVHQQLVEFGSQSVCGQSQRVRDRSRRVDDRRAPLVAELELLRIEFVRVADLSIDQRLRAFPVRCDLADIN